MPDDNRIPPGAVEAAAAALDRLTEKLRPSLHATIRRLLPKIEAAMAAGASHEEILAAIRESGIDVTLNTFRSALYRARRKAAADEPQEPRQGSGKGPPADRGTGGKEKTTGATGTVGKKEAGAVGKEKTVGKQEAARERDPLALPDKPKAFDWDPTARPKITFITGNGDDGESAS